MELPKENKKNPAHNKSLIPCKHDTKHHIFGNISVRDSFSPRLLPPACPISNLFNLVLTYDIRKMGQRVSHTGNRGTSGTILAGGYGNIFDPGGTCGAGCLFSPGTTGSLSGSGDQWGGLSPGVRGTMRMMTNGMKVTQSLAVRRSVRTSLGTRMDPCRWGRRRISGKNKGRNRPRRSTGEKTKAGLAAVNKHARPWGIITPSPHLLPSFFFCPHACKQKNKKITATYSIHQEGSVPSSPIVCVPHCTHAGVFEVHSPGSWIVFVHCDLAIRQAQPIA